MSFISNFPFTSMILGFTVLISLIALYKDESIFDKLILHPFGMFRNSEYYRLISHAFLHADIWHLMFNMFSFHSFAPYLEMKFGPTRFLVLYFGAILVSVYTTVMKNRYNAAYRCLGASGGVSGVIFAFILLEPNAKLRILIFPIPAPAYIFGLIYLAYSYFSSQNDDNINHEAHFYGAIFGIFITALFFPESVGNFMQQIRG